MKNLTAKPMAPFYVAGMHAPLKSNNNMAEK
jgi:hypothetical protein